MRKLMMVVFATMVLAVPAAAQDYKPVDVNFGFGWAFPTGDFGSTFDTGWNGAIGVTFNINENLGIQGEYTYARMGGPDRVVRISETPGGLPTSDALIESNHQMHIGTANLIYKSSGGDRVVGGYVLGGLGLYHRIVQLTTPSVGYATVCDPYWYVCYPTLVSIDTIIGDRSSNDFGINFGGGVTFGREGKFYAETRYHYVWGPEVRAQGPVVSGGPCQAEACSTNASYFPITFGFRW
jgi:hypothetical protein